MMPKTYKKKKKIVGLTPKPTKAYQPGFKQTAPIAHWSPSSMRQFLRERLSFKKKYIMGVYDEVNKPASVIGTACHRAAERYFKGSKIKNAIIAGKLWVKGVPDNEIDYGKTGSRKQMMDRYIQTVDVFFDGIPLKPGKILGVEMKIVQPVVTDPHYVSKENANISFPIPGKTYTDLAFRDKKKRLKIWDYKFSWQFKDPEAIVQDLFIQAMFNYHTVWQELKERPYSITFWLVKGSENRDEKKPQLVPYEIVFKKHPEYFRLFYYLYFECTDEIMKPDCKFLPNFSDIFDGKISFENAKDNLIDFRR
jgi:hypothetical protein